MPTKPVSIVHEITDGGKSKVKQCLVVTVNFDVEDNSLDVHSVDLYENGAFKAEISNLLDTAPGSPLDAILDAVNWQEIYSQTNH